MKFNFNFDFKNEIQFQNQYLNIIYNLYMLYNIYNLYLIYNIYNIYVSCCRLKYLNIKIKQNKKGFRPFYYSTSGSGNISSNGSPSYRFEIISNSDVDSPNISM